MDDNILVYIFKKVVILALSIFLLSVVLFYITRLVPGDPLRSYYGDRVEKMTPEERDKAEEKLGLHEPIHTQYKCWLTGAVKGDFGISYKYKTDVLEVIGGRIGNTLLIGGLGFLIIFFGSLLLGVLCAWFEGCLPDKILCKGGTIISCIPEFWLALIFILIFSVYLGWLPSSGAYSIGHSKDIENRLRHLVLPLLIVVINHLWYYAYMVRNKLMDEVRKDYILLAKSKGLNKREMVFKHCLRNVMPAYLSIMAIAIPHIMGGTYIVEMVFSYPGIGTLAYESAKYHDYNLIMILCILSGTVVIVCNMIVQVINERIDPRIRYGKKERLTEGAEDV